MAAPAKQSTGGGAERNSGSFYAFFCEAAEAHGLVRGFSQREIARQLKINESYVAIGVRILLRAGLIFKVGKSVEDGSQTYPSKELYPEGPFYQQKWRCRYNLYRVLPVANLDLGVTL